MWSVSFPLKSKVFPEGVISDRYILLEWVVTNVTVQMEALDAFTGKSLWRVDGPTYSNWTGIIGCDMSVGSEFWYTACTPVDLPIGPCYGYPVSVEKRSLADGSVVWTQPSIGWVACNSQITTLSANEDVLFMWSNWGGDPQPDSSNWVAAISTTCGPAPGSGHTQLCTTPDRAKLGPSPRLLSP